jgi:hypothetical protein
MYRNDLSIRLAALQDLSHSVPDTVTLQKELDCLNDFATKWELRTIDQDWQNQNDGVLLKLLRAELLVSIKMDKTKIMVFYSSSRVLNCSY